MVTFLSVSVNANGKELSEEYDTVYEIYQEGDFVKAKEEALKLLPRAKQEKSTFYLVKLYFLLGYLVSHTDDTGNAILYYLEGARSAEQSNDPELKANLISMYKNLAVILGNYQHYALSHKFIDRGIKIAVALDDIDQVKSLLHNRISELLKEEMYEKALQQIDSLQSQYALEGIALLKVKNQAGIAYENTGNTNQAMSEYRYVIENGRDTDPEICSHSLQNLANIYLEKNDFETALALYKEQTAIAKQEGLNQLLFQALELTGRTYFLKGKPVAALPYLEQAVLLDKAGDLKPDSYKVYETLRKVHESIDNIDKALHYGNIHTQRLEKFIEDQEKLAELNRQYNIQLLAEKHFDLLAAQQSQQEMENLVKIGLAAIAILSLFGLGFYFNQFQLKDKENKFEI